MVGSIGERMQSITLPHVAAWNVWWSDYGNTPEGFAAVKAVVDDRIADAGRTGEVAATAAVHVQLPGGTGRRMGDYPTAAPPITGPADEIADRLRGFADAGAEHVQLVADPIVPASIGWLADVLRALR